jgi:hypothetical protein
MKTRKLGTLEVSEMGFGCMSISANYGPPADTNQGIDVIRAAHDMRCLDLDSRRRVSVRAPGLLPRSWILNARCPISVPLLCTRGVTPSQTFEDPVLRKLS